MSRATTILPQSGNITNDLTAGDFSPSPKGLDTNKNKWPLPVCSSRSKIRMLAVNRTAKIAILFAPRCKQWACPECAQINVSYWRFAALYGCQAFDSQAIPLYFLTITSHERLSTASATVRVFKSAWPVLRKRLERETPRMAYFGVPEAHKSGRLHFHFITQARVTKKWLKDNARECGLGYMADAERLADPVGGAFYMTKYLTKTLDHADWPPRFRRVRLSDNWPRPPELMASEDWTFRPLGRAETLQDIAAEYHALRYRVELTDHRTAWLIVDSVP